MEGERRGGERGGEPPVESMLAEVGDPVGDPRNVPENIRQELDPGQSPWATLVGTSLQALEVPPHCGALPGPVAAHARDLVPIVVVWIDSDQSVVRGTTAQGCGSRIQHSVPGGYELVIPPLAVVFFVVPDEIVPCHEGVLAGHSGGRGHRGGDAFTYAPGR